MSAAEFSPASPHNRLSVNPSSHRIRHMHGSFEPSRTPCPMVSSIKIGRRIHGISMVSSRVYSYVLSLTFRTLPHIY